MPDSYIQELFAERIGGRQYGKSDAIYKFERIKRAKRAAMAAHPGTEIIDLGIGEPDEMARPAVVKKLCAEARKPENRGYADNGDAVLKAAAARYVELNPLRAKLVERARAWPWSSAKAHLSGRDDRLVKVAPLLAMVGDWKAFLRSATTEEELRDLREHGRTGRPLGSSAFMDRLESLVGRVLKPQKPGPKPKPRKPRTRKRTN